MIKLRENNMFHKVYTHTHNFYEDQYDFLNFFLFSIKSKSQKTNLIFTTLMKIRSEC